MHIHRIAAMCPPRSKGLPPTKKRATGSLALLANTHTQVGAAGGRTSAHLSTGRHAPFGHKLRFTPILSKSTSVKCTRNGGENEGMHEEQRRCCWVEEEHCCARWQHKLTRIASCVSVLYILWPFIKWAAELRASSSAQPAGVADRLR